EKPDPAEAISDLANTGIYVLEPEALRYVPEGAFFDFANDLFPHLLAAGEKFVGYEGDFYWSDVGTLEAYKAVQADALSGRVRVQIPGERLGEGLWVGEGARLHATAAIEGSVVLGQNAVLGRGVRVLGGGSGRSGLPGATGSHPEEQRPAPRRSRRQQRPPRGQRRRARLQRASGGAHPGRGPLPRPRRSGGHAGKITAGVSEKAPNMCQVADARGPPAG
nr:NDP-sugar synthase [Actinomycetota bacterium]